MGGRGCGGCGGEGGRTVLLYLLTGKYMYLLL